MVRRARRKYVTVPAIGEAPTNWASSRQEWSRARNLGAMPLPDHSPVTTETVRDEIAQVLVDRAYFRLVSKAFEGIRNDRPEEQWAFLDSLSPGLQMLWSTTLLDEELFNGGIEQYFWNSSHWYVEQALRDLPLIGAQGQLRILGTAIDVVRRVVPDTNWRDPSWRSVLYAAGELPELRALTNDDWTLEPTLDSDQIAYIEKHRSEFVLDEHGFPLPDGGALCTSRGYHPCTCRSVAVRARQAQVPRLSAHSRWPGAPCHDVVLCSESQSVGQFGALRSALFSCNDASCDTPRFSRSSSLAWSALRLQGVQELPATVQVPLRRFPRATDQRYGQSLPLAMPSRCQRTSECSPFQPVRN